MFGLSRSSYLGIDFGTASIKAVELQEKGGVIELVNFGQVSLASLQKKDGLSSGQGFDEMVVNYLKALLQKMNPQVNTAYVAMPAFIGLISLVDFPEMEDRELEEAVQYEAKRFIPASLDDIALSWDIIGRHTLPDNSIRSEILVVAALKNEVERYRSYIESANLKMEFLELETFSLARAAVGEQKELCLLIDIGARATNLLLVENGLVRVSRNLDIGGNDITRTLSETLDITPERSEILKRSNKDFLNEPEAHIEFPSLNMVVDEGNRMIAAHLQKFPERPCREVILSGGTAGLTGIAPYFEKTLGRPVRKANPWGRIHYDPKYKNDIEEIDTSFSVAIGLALMGIDGEPEPIHSKKKSFKEIFQKKL